MRKSKKLFFSVVVSMILVTSFSGSAFASNASGDIESIYLPINGKSMGVMAKGSGITWTHDAWVNESYGSTGPIEQAECTTNAVNNDDPTNSVYHYSRARMELIGTGKIAGDSGRQWGYTNTSAISGWASWEYLARTYYGN